jgi:Putative peptidoglycan binding domain
MMPELIVGVQTNLSTAALARPLEQIQSTSFISRGKNYMETVAYLEVAQELENSELVLERELSAGLKISNRFAAAVGASATALVSVFVSSAPALATYGCCRPISRPIVHNPCCRPISRPIVHNPCCRPVQRPVYYPINHGGCSSSCYSEDHGYDEGDGDYTGISFSPYTDGNNLSLGDAGQTVALLQQVLADLGYPVSVDGLFGHETAAAVAAYQADQGLFVDGIAGGQTLDSLGIAGAGA